MKAKNIMKELIIFLLLLLAVILILGVLLYEYVPSNKMIPEKVSYTTPEDVKAELQAENETGTDNVVVTYSIDATDLSNYKKIQEYDSGRTNPFAEVQEQPTDTNTTATQGTTSTGTSNGTTTSGNTGSATQKSTQTSSSNNASTTAQGSTNIGTTSNGSSGASTSTETHYLPDKGTK